MKDNDKPDPTESFIRGFRFMVLMETVKKLVEELEELEDTRNLDTWFVSKFAKLNKLAPDDAQTGETLCYATLLNHLYIMCDCSAVEYLKLQESFKRTQHGAPPIEQTGTVEYSIEGALEFIKSGKEHHAKEQFGYN